MEPQMTQHQHLVAELADVRADLDEARRDNLTMQGMFWVVALVSGLAGAAVTISAMHIGGII
jgi:hypothetical protein